MYIIYAVFQSLTNIGIFQPNLSILSKFIIIIILKSNSESERLHMTLLRLQLFAVFFFCATVARIGHASMHIRSISFRASFVLLLQCVHCFNCYKKFSAHTFKKIVNQIILTMCTMSHEVPHSSWTLVLNFSLANFIFFPHLSYDWPQSLEYRCASPSSSPWHTWWEWAMCLSFLWLVNSLRFFLFPLLYEYIFLYKLNRLYE